MASIASSLAHALPKPKYTGEDEEARSTTAQRGPRIVTRAELAAASGDTQLVLKRAGPPPYGKRQGWRPRSAEDFGDGGAFPEVPFAQYPLDMGRAGTSTAKNNALAIQVDGEGKVKYDAIARQGHSEGRVIHTSFKDLIPLRQRAEAGTLNLDRPDTETVAETTERTKNALALLVNGAVAASKPKTLAHMAGNNKREATYVRYTPASNQMGDASKRQDRVMKIVERQKDPLEPPKFKHKKIPRGPPSPPPPVMHSPPRKLTAADQEAWKIPPPISNWKNPKGYTVPLDKRLAAAGKGLEDVSINDKFAQFSEALFMADRHAREDVRKRAQMQQLLAEKEKEKKEEHLRQLAQQARAERAEASSGRRRARSRSDSLASRDSRDSRDSRGSRDARSYRSNSQSRSRSRSHSYDSRDSEDAAVREREEARRERRRDEERKMRQARMGGERRMQVLAREQNRDISERVALGLAKPTASAEAMYDSRLFNQTSGFDSGYNEDNIYDKPMFAAQDAITSIYRARGANGADDDDFDEAAGDAEMAKIQKASRFGEALGRGTFKGARDAEAREGPVQFEKESAGLSVGGGGGGGSAPEADPFNVDQFLSEVGQSSSGGGDASGGSSSKRGYGLQEGGSSRQSKRARVEDDE